MKLSVRTVTVTTLLALLGAVPLYAGLADQPFYLTFFGRVLIFALAAASLGLILGYGGMVSFGHALYLGIGAYAVAVLSHHGVSNGWLHLGVAIAVSALVAFLTGIVCLRTTGISFIMITLAFAQMFFFLAVSLKYYGGDDGLSIARRSDFAILDLNNATVFYYVAYALLVATLYGSYRLVNSHFGMVLRGCRSNERRMRALGFPTLRYKLAAYVISATLCGIAGLLLANLTRFASPEYMSWTRSGDLILMVVAGGMHTLVGALVGALALTTVEELLASLTDHWMAILGPLIVALVLLSKHGLYGAVVQWDRNRSRA